MTEQVLIAVRELVLEQLPSVERLRPILDSEDLFARGLDSLGTATLVGGLESGLGITIPDERLSPEYFGSIQSIASLVTELRAIEAGAEAGLGLCAS